MVMHGLLYMYIECVHCHAIKDKIKSHAVDKVKKLWYYRHLVSSVGRAPDCSAEGRGFEPQTGPTLMIRVLK